MTLQTCNSEQNPSHGRPDLLDEAKMVLARIYTDRYPINERLDAAIGRKVNKSGVHAKAFVLPHRDVKVSLSSAIDLCNVLGIETSFRPRVRHGDEVIMHEAPIRLSEFDNGLHLCRALRIELGEAMRRFADREGLKIKDIADRLQTARPTISSLMSDDLDRQFGPRAALQALKGLGMEVELGMRLQDHGLPDFSTFKKVRRRAMSPLQTA
jgi:predicted XRE-type DNA-binding protein